MCSCPGLVVFQVKTALYIMHERHRHELYSNLHGDKETYWLACELIGGLDCGVSEYAAGEMGQLKQAGDRECLYGNLLQFHPDNPSWIVHCNCKPQVALLAYSAHIKLTLWFELVEFGDGFNAECRAASLSCFMRARDVRFSPRWPFGHVLMFV
eukprot:1726372-Pleurochrysis_carterae.AAC.1